MAITLNGSGTVTGISAGGLPDGSITPADLSTGAPTWDSSGRLLVGTSTARSNFFNTTTLSPSFQLESTASDGRLASIVFNNNSASAPYLILGKTRAAANNENTIVAANDALGVLSFQGADGNELVQAAEIFCEVDGTPGANDMPGRLVFSTTADGASSPTERMRITNAGYLWINRTTAPPTVNSLLAIAGGATNLCAIFDRTVDDDSLRFTRSGALVGSISVTTTATAYNTSSDYRLKENVIPLTGATDRVKQLKPSQFNFIADPDTTIDGFIAHEAQAVVPECVTGEKDAEDEDGNPKYQGIDQSKLVPLLTAALQEAIAKIETLEASNADLLSRVAALEVTP